MIDVWSFILQTSPSQELLWPPRTVYCERKVSRTVKTDVIEVESTHVRMPNLRPDADSIAWVARTVAAVLARPEGLLDGEAAIDPGPGIFGICEDLVCKLICLSDHATPIAACSLANKCVAELLS